MSIIEIFPRGDSLTGDWFIGNAFLHPLVGKDKNNNFSAGNVSFEVNAITNWHTHPKEQVLLIIDGQGLYQEKEKPAKQIRKGDVINIPENIEHWHGASSTSQITHIAITNYEGDNQVNWLQPVSADEYSTANK
jgi:quercetin dioxygenase-like cupin family protein